MPDQTREIDLPPLRAGQTLTVKTAHPALWRIDFGVYGSVAVNIPIGGTLKITAAEPVNDFETVTIAIY